MRKEIEKVIIESINTKQQLLENNMLLEQIELLSNKIVNCLKNNGKLVICGNGGSASDALHFAGEIVGRFLKERKPWPAVVLNADVTTLTAIANDYGYDEAFARQAEAHLTAKDIFIGISTSGNSSNVIKAVEIAHNIGAHTVAFLGKDGGKIKNLVDIPIVIPCNTTARVQECHITIIHIVCSLVEKLMTEE